MPRDLFRLLLNERAEAHNYKKNGVLMSKPKLITFGTNAVPMPCADVRLGKEIISSVPISDNSHDMLYAQAGSPVELQRSHTGRMEITGLSKRSIGNVYEYSLAVSTGILVSGTVTGYSTRTATLGELATATTGGFGVTPLASLVLLDANGSILHIVL
jgi:hypothetical protein